MKIIKTAKTVHYILLASFALCNTLPAQAQTAVHRAAHPAIKTAVAAMPAAPRLPLKRVILYSNGVAYFERQGTIDGNQVIGLQFSPQELDDVLKSMVVLDLGDGASHGSVAEVSFDTAKPMNIALSEFSFNLADDGGNNGGITKLLSSFKGAGVEVRDGGASFSGRVVGIETRDNEKADGSGPRPQTRWLTLINENGEARSFQLSQISSIRLLDPALRAAVARYMSLIGSANLKDNRTISINAAGTSPRQMLVGYTIAAPIWKTSYRAVIDKDGKPFLQGWAIVDNVQDEDWENVDLSLVSGMPISFIENLKQPFYRNRPVVSLPQGYQIMPQTSEADIKHDSQPVSDQTLKNQPIMHLDIAGDSNGFFHPLVDHAESGGRLELVQSNAAFSDATTRDVGELFQYHIGHPVTISHNHSAMIPIVQAQVEGEAVSVYNERAHYGNPLNGLSLKNTTGLTLEGGPITVLEGNSYAGGALMDRLKPNETRLITYAVDLGVRVSTRNDSEQETVTQIRIFNGQLGITTKRLTTVTYSVENVTDKSKVVVIEHSRRVGFKLIGEARPTSESENFSRFRLELKPNAVTKLVVKEEEPLIETHEVSNFTPDKITIVLKQRAISPELREKLTLISELKTREVALTASISLKQQMIDNIFKDQQRLRENIKSLGQSPDERRLVSCYVIKLEETETSIDQLRRDIAALQEATARLNEQINAAFQKLATE